MKSTAKYFILIAVIGIITLLTGTGGINAQNTDQGGAGQQKKERQDGLVEDWLDDFENCEDWRALSTCPIGDTKIRKVEGKPRPVDQSGKSVNERGESGEFSEDVTDENGLAHKNKNVLGVRTYFLDRGFDRVEVFPPNEYIIRGKAKEIKIWVLGRKFRHTLSVKLRDFKGNLHKLKIGTLDFWGWKEMTLIIPGWLPQSASYALLDKNLHFVSFYVESDRFEIPGTFYFYMDQFRVVTDLSEFSGDETIKDTW